MSVKLYPFQQEAIEKLNSGSILCGGVGTGKSITSLAYYYVKECDGYILDTGELKPPVQRMKNLFIITTARKRDTKEWDKEMEPFGLSQLPLFSLTYVKVDSWNNIEKYETEEDAFFIFDEQRVVGSGAWAKSFIKIAKKNRWILLSATPGDTWMDYIPVFIANGFYKNRTEFTRRHVIFDHYCTSYPKIKGFVETGHLERLRRSITVVMDFKKKVARHFLTLNAAYDPDIYNRIWKDRWDPWEMVPIENVAQLFYLMRKCVNSDISRIEAVESVMKQSKRIIIFYNFDYELEILRGLSSKRTCAEWNGHKHEPIPETDEWLYFVQYAAGAEGWNCTSTDTIIFFSQNYSYKMMEQAAGRIDRMNTPYSDLYYYIIKGSSPIDAAIAKALKSKQNFNENAFIKQMRI